MGVEFGPWSSWSLLFMICLYHYCYWISLLLLNCCCCSCFCSCCCWWSWWWYCWWWWSCRWCCGVAAGMYRLLISDRRVGNCNLETLTIWHGNGQFLTEVPLLPPRKSMLFQSFQVRSPKAKPSQTARFGEGFVENVPGCQLLCMARAECAGFELRAVLSCGGLRVRVFPQSWKLVVKNRSICEMFDPQKKLLTGWCLLTMVYWGEDSNKCSFWMGDTLSPRPAKGIHCFRKVGRLTTALQGWGHIEGCV